MPRSMMRSTLTNSGAVAAVENNGTFTDETATIVTVTGTGTNALAITELPSNAELKDGKAILTVAAEDANFQWQDAMGEALDDAEDATFTATAVGQYRCKVVKGTTTLYTPYVTVSEAQTSVEPGVTTYTVTLPAVEGATFSKGTTTSVDEGADFSFTITLSKDYDQSVPVVKVGDEAITADADGVYTIKNITKDITISVTGIQKNVVTGIEEIASGSKVYGAKGEIVIDLSASMRVKVISLSGAPIYSGEINGMKHIQANAGIYLISLSDGQMKVTEKVVVR